jgi:hypothetical protein
MLSLQSSSCSPSSVTSNCMSRIMLCLHYGYAEFICFIYSTSICLWRYWITFFLLQMHCELWVVQCFGQRFWTCVIAGNKIIERWDGWLITGDVWNTKNEFRVVSLFQISHAQILNGSCLYLPHILTISSFPFYTH